MEVTAVSMVPCPVRRITAAKGTSSRKAFRSASPSMRGILYVIAPAGEERDQPTPGGRFVVHNQDLHAHRIRSRLSQGYGVFEGRTPSIGCARPARWSSRNIG